MYAALHTPSGVVMSTSFSTTCRSAADAPPAAATMPAAMPIATKSRRESSFCSSGFFVSSLIVIPPLRSGDPKGSPYDICPQPSALLESQYLAAHSVGHHIQRAVRSFVDAANARVQVCKQTFLADDAIAVEHE